VEVIPGASTEAERGAYVSALDLFSIGIGPSSSHTVGPMRAGRRFRSQLDLLGLLDRVTRFECHLHGSLAATGVGHGTPDAVIAGLRGFEPETVDPQLVHGQWARLEAGETLHIDGVPLVAADLVFEPFARDHGHPRFMSIEPENLIQKLCAPRSPYGPSPAPPSSSVWP
jgi:L-serine dehydratase